MPKRTVRLLSGREYFNNWDDFSIFVNRNAESYELTEHHHDFLEMSYVSEGTGYHHTGDEVMPVSAGDLFVIPIGASHVFRPGSTAKDRQLIVYNCLTSMENATKILGLVPGGDELRRLLAFHEIMHYRDRDGEAKGWFERLYREYSVERTGRETALYAGMLQLMICIIRIHEATVEGASPPTVGMDHVLSMLHGHYSRPFTVEELAGELGIGERQFQRLFVKHTGLTPIKYLQRIRIQEACRLLRSTPRRIHDISAAVGYADIAFFNGLFKKITGMTPREYRQSHASMTRTAAGRED
ncbi:AraC family L-rhamnose operon transcriptional activator RhaR [Paenibacillus rhizosphaerae]|uniref:AraC family L-rhamnose operon transcriptional activator RhaR n=1 Tax=Paenibacillus rhizosphaerae TaxID=297318 RepID=A0A839TMJ5_9BACL|nr:AraC family transcriptional regulator [Paenibacillus rhizosphaerae]MBB3126618.1 AraC family L-rhamnose operon transcriptional activator RhaR [Paenibacillus rhizosphaerae]